MAGNETTTAKTRAEIFRDECQKRFHCDPNFQFKIITAGLRFRACITIFEVRMFGCIDFQSIEEGRQGVSRQAMEWLNRYDVKNLSELRDYGPSIPMQYPEPPDDAAEQSPVTTQEPFPCYMPIFKHERPSQDTFPAAGEIDNCILAPVCYGHNLHLGATSDPTGGRILAGDVARICAFVISQRSQNIQNNNRETQLIFNIYPGETANQEVARIYAQIILDWGGSWLLR